jgi:hypothetical protein
MSKNTNISIIQLIKSGEISVNFEISNIRAGKDINVNIRTYLEKSDHYQVIQQHIREAKTDMLNAEDTIDKLYFDEKLQNLYKVEKDFMSNTLYLAETLSKIEPRTERLKKAIELFDAGKIREADAILGEADLLNDQFALIAFVQYQRNKIQNLGNELDTESN